MKKLTFFLKALASLYSLFLIEACVKEPTQQIQMPQEEQWLLSKIVYQSGNFREYKYNAFNKPAARLIHLAGKLYGKDTFVYNASQQLIKMMSYDGTMTRLWETNLYKYDAQGNLIEQSLTRPQSPDSARTYFFYRGNAIIDSTCIYPVEYPYENCDWRGNESIYDANGNLLKRIVHRVEEHPDHSNFDTAHLTNTIEYSQYDNHPSPDYLINLAIDASGGYNPALKVSANNPGVIRNVEEVIDWSTYERSYTTTTTQVNYNYDNNGLVVTKLTNGSDSVKYEYIVRP